MRFINQNDIVTVIGDENRPTQPARFLNPYEDTETGEQGCYVYLLNDDEVDLVGPELIVLDDEDDRYANPEEEEYLEEEEYWRPTGEYRGRARYKKSDFGRAIEKGMIPPATMRALCQTQDVPPYYRKARGWGEEIKPLSEREDFRPQSVRFKIEDWQRPGESMTRTLNRIRKWANKHWPEVWGKILISEENLRPTKTKRAQYLTFSQYDADKYFKKGTLRTKRSWAKKAADGREVQLVWGIPKRELPFEPDPTVFSRTTNPYDDDDIFDEIMNPYDGFGGSGFSRKKKSQDFLEDELAFGGRRPNATGTLMSGEQVYYQPIPESGASQLEDILGQDVGYAVPGGYYIQQNGQQIPIGKSLDDAIRTTKAHILARNREALSGEIGKMLASRPELFDEVYQSVYLAKPPQRKTIRTVREEIAPKKSVQEVMKDILPQVVQLELEKLGLPHTQAQIQKVVKDILKKEYPRLEKEIEMEVEEQLEEKTEELAGELGLPPTRKARAKITPKKPKKAEAPPTIEGEKSPREMAAPERKDYLMEVIGLPDWNPPKPEKIDKDAWNAVTDEQMQAAVDTVGLENIPGEAITSFFAIKKDAKVGQLREMLAKHLSGEEPIQRFIEEEPEEPEEKKVEVEQVRKKEKEAIGIPAGMPAGFPASPSDPTLEDWVQFHRKWGSVNFRKYLQAWADTSEAVRNDISKTISKLLTDNKLNDPGTPTKKYDLDIKKYKTTDKFFRQIKDGFPRVLAKLLKDKPEEYIKTGKEKISPYTPDVFEKTGPVSEGVPKEEEKPGKKEPAEKERVIKIYSLLHGIVAEFMEEYPETAGWNIELIDEIGEVLYEAAIADQLALWKKYKIIALDYEESTKEKKPVKKDLVVITEEWLEDEENITDVIYSLYEHLRKTIKKEKEAPPSKKEEKPAAKPEEIPVEVDLSKLKGQLKKAFGKGEQERKIYESLYLMIRNVFADPKADTAQENAYMIKVFDALDNDFNLVNLFWYNRIKIERKEVDEPGDLKLGAKSAPPETRYAVMMAALRDYIKKDLETAGAPPVSESTAASAKQKAEGRKTPEEVYNLFKKLLYEHWKDPEIYAKGWYPYKKIYEQVGELSGRELLDFYKKYNFSMYNESVSREVGLTKRDITETETWFKEPKNQEDITFSIAQYMAPIEKKKEEARRKEEAEKKEEAQEAEVTLDKQLKGKKLAEKRPIIQAALEKLKLNLSIGTFTAEGRDQLLFNLFESLRTPGNILLFFKESAILVEGKIPEVTADLDIDKEETKLYVKYAKVLPALLSYLEKVVPTLTLEQIGARAAAERQQAAQRIEGNEQKQAQQSAENKAQAQKQQKAREEAIAKAPDGFFILNPPLTDQEEECFQSEMEAQEDFQRVNNEVESKKNIHNMVKEILYGCGKEIIPQIENVDRFLRYFQIPIRGRFDYSPASIEANKLIVIEYCLLNRINYKFIEDVYQYIKQRLALKSEPGKPPPQQKVQVGEPTENISPSITSKIDTGEDVEGWTTAPELEDLVNPAKGWATISDPKINYKGIDYRYVIISAGLVEGQLNAYKGSDPQTGLNYVFFDTEEEVRAYIDKHRPGLSQKHRLQTEKREEPEIPASVKDMRTAFIPNVLLYPVSSLLAFERCKKEGNNLLFQAKGTMQSLYRYAVDHDYANLIVKMIYHEEREDQEILDALIDSGSIRTEEEQKKFGVARKDYSRLYYERKTPQGTMETIVICPPTPVDVVRAVRYMRDIPLVGSEEFEEWKAKIDAQVPDEGVAAGGEPAKEDELTTEDIQEWLDALPKAGSIREEEIDKLLTLRDPSSEEMQQFANLALVKHNNKEFVLNLAEIAFAKLDKTAIIPIVSEIWDRQQAELIQNKAQKEAEEGETVAPPYPGKAGEILPNRSLTELKEYFSLALPDNFDKMLNAYHYLQKIPQGVAIINMIINESGAGIDEQIIANLLFKQYVTSRELDLDLDDCWVIVRAVKDIKGIPPYFKESATKQREEMMFWFEEMEEARKEVQDEISAEIEIQAEQKNLNQTMLTNISDTMVGMCMLFLQGDRYFVRTVDDVVAKLKSLGFLDDEASIIERAEFDIVGETYAEWFNDGVEEDVWYKGPICMISPDTPYNITADNVVEGDDFSRAMVTRWRELHGYA